MMPQGILPFQYEEEPSCQGITGLAGLPLYLEIAQVARMREVIDRRLGRIGPRQGWTPAQHILSVILLNLCGGDCVDDLDVLNDDPGFGDILRQSEVYRLGRRKRRALQRRWRKERQRSVPSPSALRRFLSLFHDPEQEQHRTPGRRAFIPAANELLRRLQDINTEFVSFAHSRQPDLTTATLDMDATLIESHKREALFCYKKYRSYQPLNTWWAEMGLVLHTEFRDGNVPAGHQQLRVFKEALSCLPDGVIEVLLRSDTAGYQWDLLRYCAEGKNQKYGRIKFAVGCDVTPEFKKAVAEVPQDQWQVLYRTVDGRRSDTGQQWAEVCFVPNGSGFSRKGPEYRFLAIREPVRQLELPGLEAPELPFPVMSFDQQRYKVFGLVSNRTTIPGEELIWWSRERCGKSEEAHAVMKADLAGGQLPSGLFGANAAWWQMMILALNLNATLKRLALGRGWEKKRLKAVRYHLINLPGRVVQHAGRVWIRVAGSCRSLTTLLEARQSILALAQGPPG